MRLACLGSALLSIVLTLVTGHAEARTPDDKPAKPVLEEAPLPRLAKESLLSVTVRVDGKQTRIALEGKTLATFENGKGDTDKFIAAIRESMRATSKQIVDVACDDAVAYETVIRVIDDVKRAGAKNVTIHPIAK